MQISELPRDDDVRFEAAMRIYQSAIEPSEQKSLSRMRRHLDDPRCHFLIAEVAGELVGFAMVFVPESMELWLLEYMAIDTSSRSAGIGSLLFQASAEAASRFAPNAPGILEVDAANKNTTASDAVARRLLFYARNGCRVIEGLDYILPLANNGQPPPMQLLLTGEVRGRRLDKSVLQRWLTTIYCEVYSQPSDDERIIKMVSQLPDTVSLGEILL